MSRFDGKVALITGAASGMGRAVALRLVREGARVFGIDVAADGLAETARLAKDAGGELQTGIHDVGRREDCFAAVDACVAAFGRLDVLANVAGILRAAHAHEMPQRDWDQVIAVNLSGPFFMSQAALPHLLRRRGNIVNVASNAALMGQAYTAAYCASKAGLVSLTKSLAMEYVKQGIRINCVCPAGTKTPLTASAKFPDAIDPQLLMRYAGFRGMSEPDEIAAVIAFVASDEASAMHGSIVQADQGVTAG
jgi:meso-butanediol dehydrogenase / (S,S)-butanediol dehydrogenase / diacetyl reductase